MTYINN